MLLRHVLASSVFILFGVALVLFSVRTWRMKPELHLLDEAPGQIFLRGFYKPANRAIMMSGPMFISVGFLAVAHSIQIYSNDHFVREIMWVPFYIFLVPFVASCVLFFSLFFASWPRALIPPAYREK